MFRKRSTSETYNRNYSSGLETVQENKTYRFFLTEYWRRMILTSITYDIVHQQPVSSKQVLANITKVWETTDNGHSDVVRSLLRPGVQRTLEPSDESETLCRFNALAQERRGIGWYMIRQPIPFLSWASALQVYAWCVGWIRLRQEWTACRVFLQRAPCKCGLLSGKPWLVLMQRQPVDVPRLFASAHVSTANILMLLIKASVTVTLYTGHRQILFFLPRIISLFIMWVRIIRNNSLVGGRARAEVWTSATERATLYCTWRPNALTTGPHGQVSLWRHKMIQ